MVSSADQKLRNRFGEFYPVERRTAVAEPNVASSTAPAPGNVIHSASQSSTFNEVVTSSTDYDSTEYDSSEVMTSWSSGRSVGTPQVSVPVTINVNNGDLMATLIETREQLAEMKVRQSAVRDEQRVFSYEVHKNQANSVTSSDTNVAAAESSSVSATSSESHLTKPSTARAAKAEVKDRAGKPSVPSVHDFSVEESVSFEPIAPPATPAAEADDDDATVPVIEPISYYVDQPFDEPAPVAQSAVLTESKRVTQSTQLSKETVVQFAPLDDAVTNNEVPASLPELNFGEPISEQSISEQTSDVPTLSIESQPEFAEVSTSHAEAASSKKASADASLPDFFAAEANTASEETAAAASQPDQSSDTGFLPADQRERGKSFHGRLRLCEDCRRKICLVTAQRPLSCQWIPQSRGRQHRSRKCLRLKWRCRL
jgi:hypothetical protein